MKRIDITNRYYVEIYDNSESYYLNDTKHLEIVNELHKTLTWGGQTITLSSDSNNARIIKYEKEYQSPIYLPASYSNDYKSIKEETPNGYVYKILCFDQLVEHSITNSFSSFEIVGNIESKQYKQLGILHRIGEPAYEKHIYQSNQYTLISSEVVYFYGGLIHRDDGPAIIKTGIDVISYYIYGIGVTKESYYCYQLNKVLPDNINITYENGYVLRIDKDVYWYNDNELELLEEHIRKII